MDDRNSTPQPRRRRERTALLAATAVLAATAIVAIGAAVLARQPDPPQARPGTAASSDASAPPTTGDGGGQELTQGPLMDSSPPVRIAIPALHMTSSVTELGLQANGRMQVPDNADTIGWFTKAPMPGALGPAVLAGHVNWKNKQGAFFNLATLTTGAAITIARIDGSVAMFTVTKIEQYPKDQFPTEAVYGPINHAGLRLITCGGEFDSSRHSYRDNVVVYAALQHAHPAA